MSREGFTGRQMLELQAAIEEAIGEVPPEDWENYDSWNGYLGYEGIVEEVDPSNSGDVHTHGYCVGEWALAWRIRKAIRRPKETD